jgi:hypothetical protein
MVMNNEDRFLNSFENEMRKIMQQQLTTLNSDQLEKLKNIWRGYEYEVRAKNLKIEGVTFNGKTDELESIKIRDGKKVTLFTKDGSKSWTE